MNAVKNRLTAYLSLTEPNIQLLGVITGAAALAIQGSLFQRPWVMILALLLLAMGGGAAKAFNQLFERRIDALMERTRERRALPAGKLTSSQALVFALILGIVAVTLMAILFNLPAALLLLASIGFYAFFYTLYLKPRSPLNIVIGGLPGSMGPVICWTAATGKFAFEPLLLAAVIFCWTPPHFWALALDHQEDYRKSGIPMLPLVVGEKTTWQYMYLSALLTVMFSLALAVTLLGPVYLVTALVTSIYFIVAIRSAGQSATHSGARRIFVLSIVYMTLHCAAIIIDRYFFA